MKICPKCRQEKSEDDFGLENKRGKQTRRSDCKVCKNAARAAQRVISPEDPERARARTKQWKKDNLEKARAQVKRYNESHPEWYAGQQRASSAKRRRNNPEKVREAQRRCYAKKSAYYAGKRRQKYYADPEKPRAQTRAWCRLNPDKVRASRALYRVRRFYRMTQQCDGTVTVEVVSALYATPQCHYCHRHTDTHSRQIDHVVPLSRGGAHSASNLVMACAPCNGSKGGKLLNEWGHCIEPQLP